MEVNKKGTNKYCVFGDCKTDSRNSAVPFLHFPNACLNVRKQFIMATKAHMKECEKCRKCNRWIIKCKRNDGRFNNVLHVNKHTYICSLHFVNKVGPCELYPDPLPVSVVEKINRVSRKRKYVYNTDCTETSTKRTKKSMECIDKIMENSATEPSISESRSLNSLVCEASNSMQLLDSEVRNKVSISISTQCDRPSYVTKSTQTTFTWHDVAALKDENRKLKQFKKSNETQTPLHKTEKILTLFVNSIEKDDKRCYFYTGLVFKQILMLLTFLSPPNNIKYWGEKETTAKLRKRKSTHLEELIVMLVRIRSGLLVRDLRYRFNLSEGLITKLVITWIQLMYLRFDKVRSMMFCSRQKIKENLPAIFRRLKNIRIIIGCTEFFCQSPANFEHQGNLYSNYKAHTTFKILIGCTPNGAVSFVSELFEGSISDKELVNKSNLMDLLEEGDLVLADRGFTIEDMANKKNVHLNIPPFLKGREKLTPSEEIETKKIAKERIYVEHVIGRLKQFRLLKRILPLNMRDILSQMVFVCSCLLNFQDPIVQPSEN